MSEQELSNILKTAFFIGHHTAFHIPDIVLDAAIEQMIQDGISIFYN